MDLSGKTVIVTGCASGIGAATARALKAAGAAVVGVDIREGGGADEFHRADLGDRASIDALVDALPAGAHGLANIAGVPPTADPELVIRINFVGLKYLTQRLVPSLCDGASIVNLASLAGAGWRDNVAAIREAFGLGFNDVAAFVARHAISNEGGRSYLFSKEALVAWTHANRWTWRERGIRMNAISPGPVDTPILPDFIATLGARAQAHMAVMDRPGRPEDIAPVVAFLMSDAAAWFRGADLALDGGLAAQRFAVASGLEDPA